MANETTTFGELPTQNDRHNESSQASTETAGCMVCTTKVPLKSYRDLKPGDHIQMKGNLPFFGRFYNHHAIVSQVNESDDNKMSNVKVIDVPYAGICKKSLRLDEHSMTDEVKIKRVDYRKRRHNHGVTLKRANEYKKVMNSDKKNQNCDGGCCCCCCFSCLCKHKYCICLRNCEHFAKTVVNGQSKIDSDEFNNSVCSQAVAWFWRLFHILIFLIQAVSYGWNFYIYAVFVANDDEFDHFTKELKDGLKMCYNRYNNAPGVDTWCDWLVLVIMVGLLEILFMIYFWRQSCLYSKRNICKQCFITSIILMTCKLFLFIVMSVINIFIEKPLYERIAPWHDGMAVTISFTTVIALIEAFFIYGCSHGLAKLILWVIPKWCRRCSCFDDVNDDDHSYVMSYIG